MHLAFNKTRGRELLLSDMEVDSISSRIDLKGFADKTILITGGSGMVGGYLTETLCRVLEIQNVVPDLITATSGTGDFSNIAHLKRYKSLSLVRSRLDESRDFPPHNFVIHGASPASPTQYDFHDEILRVNAGAIRTLISSETEKFLFVSSGEVYGTNAPLWVKEDFVGQIDTSLARSVYPIAKRHAENIGTELCHNAGIEMQIARLFHTFGPGVREGDGRSFADFLWRSAKGQFPILKSKGGDVRAFLYSGDAVVALLKILIQKQTDGPFNVGSQQPISILEFAKQVSNIAGLGGEIEYDFTESNYTHSPNHVIVPDTSRLQQLGWHQEYSLVDAVASTLNWIRTRNAM